MRNKGLCGAVLCAGLSLLLAACASSNEPVGKSTNDFPAEYVRKNEALDFDAEIVVGNGTKAYLYRGSAYRVVFNKGSVIPLMIRGKTQIDSAHSNDYYHAFDNGNGLYMYNDYISYSSNSQRQKAITSSFELFTGHYTADRFVSTVNGEELQALDGKREVEKLLQDLNVKNVDLFKCYVLDYQTLQKNEQHIAPDGTDRIDRYKPEWSEADNSNYWLGIERWQGIPVFCSSFYDGMNDTWSPIQVLYTLDGIEKVQILYSFEFVQSDEKIVLQSFDTIANAMIENYSMLLTDDKHMVKKAELFFWVDVNQMEKSFDMVPVWILTIREYMKENTTEYKEYSELVHAETAEILEVGN